MCKCIFRREGITPGVKGRNVPKLRAGATLVRRSILSDHVFALLGVSSEAPPVLRQSCVSCDRGGGEVGRGCRLGRNAAPSANSIVVVKRAEGCRLGDKSRGVGCSGESLQSPVTRPRAALPQEESKAPAASLEAAPAIARCGSARSPRRWSPAAAGACGRCCFVAASACERERVRE